MNRITRLALVAVVPVGAALAVAIPPALAGSTGSGQPSAAIAGMSSQLQAEDEKETKKPDAKPTETKKTVKPTETKTTPPTASPTRTVLPVTGGDSNPSVLWLVASGLLTAGGGLLLLARRLRGKAGA